MGDANCRKSVEITKSGGNCLMALVFALSVVLLALQIRAPLVRQLDVVPSEVAAKTSSFGHAGTSVVPYEGEAADKVQPSVEAQTSKNGKSEVKVGARVQKEAKPEKKTNPDAAKDTETKKEPEEIQAPKKPQIEVVSVAGNSTTETLLEEADDDEQEEMDSADSETVDPAATCPTKSGMISLREPSKCQEKPAAETGANDVARATGSVVPDDTDLLF